MSFGTVSIRILLVAPQAGWRSLEGFVVGALCGFALLVADSARPLAGAAGEYGRGDTVRFDKWALWSAGETRLRGANIHQQHELWFGDSTLFGPAATMEQLRLLRAADANYVNLSVPGTFHVRQNERWPEMEAHLDRLVSSAAEADLFVVISFRTGPGRGEGDIICPDTAKCCDQLRDRSVYHNRGQRAAWARMWKRIARRYGPNPYVVGFDLMVEPHGVKPGDWHAFAERMIRSIRDVDSVTPILVSPPGWGGLDGLSGWTPPRGHRVVSTLHQYEPTGYTQGQDTTFGRDTVAALYREVERWLGTPKGPLVVNEFGVRAGRNASREFLLEQIGQIERLGLNHAVWQWTGEADDPSYDGRMDFRRHPKELEAIRGFWKHNRVWPSSFALGRPPGPLLPEHARPPVHSTGTPREVCIPPVRR